MKQAFYDAFMDNPIVAAIKDEEGLEVCIRRNDLQIVFVLYGEATTIGQIVDRLKEAGKTVMVHIDLVGGLSGKRGGSPLYQGIHEGRWHYFNEA